MSITPIEGTTTTQVNVRAQTSTASDTLGIVGQFAKVQVIGKDASGSWFQIVYADSVTGYGWVRAEYVQMNASAEVPVVGGVGGNGSGVSGLVVQKINVRKGPATTYDSLGVLNPKDVVFITGKDPSGAWMQIEYVNAPDGYGWASLEFLQVDNVDSLPVVGNAGQSTESVATEESNLVALQDGDSKDAPLAMAIFSAANARALQLNGDVSAPNGDREDWIQFESYAEIVSIQMICTSNTLDVELWNNEEPLVDFSITCGEKQIVTITPNSMYFIRLTENGSNGFQYTSYHIKLEIIR
ncbi:MAG TPA: SH3 domain-containing protein [Anaerolineales bacterium]|nr:SH3 domain-containing protein [Anaerolineales bacterium]